MFRFPSLSQMKKVCKRNENFCYFSIPAAISNKKFQNKPSNCYNLKLICCWFSKTFKVKWFVGSSPKTYKFVEDI